jgi:hypothetical protein
MKISLNSVGNYSKPGVNKTRSKNISKEKKSAETEISAKEKKFFAKLYPENKNEIMEYHFYRKNGKVSGVSKGTLIDQRG